MDFLKIPLTFCEQLAKEKLGLEKCTIVNYIVESLGEYKNGFMGEHSILKITIKECNEEMRFFVKSEPKVDSLRNFAQTTNVFLKENGFYHKIIPEFKKYIKEIDEIVPISYKYKENILILEDLSIKGYKIFNSKQQLSLQMIKSALITFATFHASCLIYEEKISEKMGKNYRIINDFQMELKESFYCKSQMSIFAIESTSKGISTQIDIFKEINIKNRDEFKTFIINIWNKVYKFTKPSEKIRNVICQADPWITNLMFQTTKSEIKCKLIDYQMNRYSPPSQDVITFLYLCTNREFRKNHLKNCLEFYYNELKKILQNYNIPESILPEKDFWNSVKYYEPFAMVQNLNHSHLTKLSPQMINVLFENPNFMHKFIFEDKSEGLIKMCGDDSFYREKQKETVLDLLELFEQNNYLDIEI